MLVIRRNGKHLWACRSCGKVVGFWRNEHGRQEFAPAVTAVVRYRIDGTLIVRCQCGHKNELPPLPKPTT